MPTIPGFRKGRWIWALGVLMLALAVGGAWALYYFVIAPRIAAERASAAQAAALGEAARDDHAGRYDEEARVLESYLRTNPPSQYRYQPLMILGNLAFDKRDDTGAVKYYQQAVAVNSGSIQLLDAESIAQAAAAAGDKATAIKYYKLAIKLTDVHSGMGNNIDEFKATIINLGGTP